jgi:hypothetical protein
MLIPSLVAFVKVHHPSMCFTLSSLQPWAFDVCFWYPHVSPLVLCLPLFFPFLSFFVSLYGLRCGVCC